MRLPSKLLGCMRVGVSVSAMMMGGCDAIAEAKARVLGDEPAEAPAAVEAPVAAPVATTTTAPEPMLLPRDGISGVVADTVARSKASAIEGDRSQSLSQSRPLPPVEDLGRPRSEPESSRSFVPFSGSGSSGALAGTVEVSTREVASPTPRTRPRPKLARPVEDEPCDPSVSTPITAPEPGGGWVCGPCGRG